ncbi:MAG: 7TM diverse intracellular signaling domain-containing protein [Bdellovibrionota bacterium]
MEAAQNLALYNEAVTPLLHRDIGVFLLAIAFVLFGLFWRSPQNREETSFAFFTLMVSLLSLSLSGWFYRYSDFPFLNFRLHVLIVCCALSAQIRFVSLYRGFKPLEKLSNVWFLLAALILFGLPAFLIPGHLVLLTFYLYTLVVLTSLSCALWISPVFRISQWGTSRTIELCLFFIHFGVFWDVARIWKLHDFENISPYTYGLCTIVIALVLASRLTQVFENATRTVVMEAKTKELSIIAQTVRMLAHDVRRPFSMLKMGLDQLRLARNPEETRELADYLVPNVDRALLAVDGMVQDVMGIGPAALKETPASPASLVQAALHECFRLHPDAEISLSYDFGHRHLLLVDSLRSTAFSLIL